MSLVSAWMTTIDIQEIPSPTTSPAISSLPDGKYTFIALELETTGLDLYYFAQELYFLIFYNRITTYCDIYVCKHFSISFRFAISYTNISVHLGLSSITQIAASCGELKFNQYVLPDEEISLSAAATTGISFDGVSLYKEGEKLNSIPLPRALDVFPLVTGL